MDQTHDFDRTQAIPLWREPAEARTLIRTTLDDFLDDALRSLLGEEGSPPPTLTLAVSAGLGKTRTTLEVLAERGPSLLEHGHVLIFVPTLELAEEVAGAFASLAPHVPQAVFRGRLAVDPQAMPVGKDVDPLRMCLQHKLVEHISGVVRSVSEALCQARDPSGNFYQAPCAQTCGYMRQLRQSGHRVIFLSHAYLTVPVPFKEPIALRVIDEKAWAHLLSSPHISVEDWLKPPSSGFPGQLGSAHHRTRFGLLSALQEGRPILDDLRDKGVTADLLRQLAERETAKTPELVLRPWNPDSHKLSLIKGFDRRGWSTGRMRAAIFRHLAASFDRPTTEYLSLAELRSEAGPRQVVRLHGRQEMPADCPLLMLDADADERIVKRICPSAEVVRIESKPEADIVQITDSTLSNTYLLHPEKGAQRRAAVLQVIRQETAQSGEAGCLVVATQPVLKALQADAPGEMTAAVGDGRMKHECGAMARWFGPRMQGINEFANTGTIVVVGRLQPPTGAVEDTMRCLFADGETPLRFAHEGKLSKVTASRLMSDDRLEPAAIQSHPDPCGAAVLAQMRERASLQAIARLRLIAPIRPKRVILLGSLVLPGLPISRLTTLRALSEGMETEEDLLAYRRLAQALGDGRRPSVIGIRLSAAGLKEDLPSAFEAETSAKTFRRGRGTEWLHEVIQRIAGARGWSCTRVDLAVPTGGRAIPAVTFVGREEAEVEALRLWPDLRVQRVL